jgi:hypothetical protein
MSKQDKKVQKMHDQLHKLEEELKLALTKKTSSVAEISVSDYTRRIQDLRKKLSM